MLIGTVFNILLFGIMITQVYIYYTSYRRWEWIIFRMDIQLLITTFPSSDRLFMKLLVRDIALKAIVNESEI
jgi:hypothetical protein